MKVESASGIFLGSIKIKLTLAKPILQIIQLEESVSKTLNYAQHISGCYRLNNYL